MLKVALFGDSQMKKETLFAWVRIWGVIVVKKWFEVLYWRLREAWCCEPCGILYSGSCGTWCCELRETCCWKLCGALLREVFGIGGKTLGDN